MRPVKARLHVGIADTLVSDEAGQYQGIADTLV
jgi:hypothetical protein